MKRIVPAALLALTLAVACAMAHGRDSLACDSYCKNRHPRPPLSWDGDMMTPKAQKACYRNCVRGGAFEAYEGAEEAQSDEPYEAPAGSRD